MYLTEHFVFVCSKKRHKRTYKRRNNKVPTCRVSLPKTQWCRSCVQKRKADCCVHRIKAKKDAADNRLLPERRRNILRREYHACFASDEQLHNLDERLQDDVTLLYPWCPSVRQGGIRKSLRIQLNEEKKAQLENGKSVMKRNPLHILIRLRKLNQGQMSPPASPQATQPTTPVSVDVPATAATTTNTPTIDTLFSQRSKRRS